MSEKCEHGFKPPCPENYPFTGPHADECTGAVNGQHVYAESVCGSCGHVSRDALAAAEERGRRRGVEEARKRAESVIHVLHQCIRGKCDCGPGQFACEETARTVIDSWDLAPRNSGKEPNRYCDEPHPSRSLKCGRFVQHDGPHTAYDPDFSFEGRRTVHWEARK